MKKVSVGLVGYGLSGSVFQAPLISSVEGLMLTKVVSASPPKVKQDYPDAIVVATFEELLADSSIELVVISSPNYTHYSYAKQALAADKHVVVEKPFVSTVQQANELIALATEKKRVLSVFQNRRWDNDFLTLRKCLEDRLLGDVYLYEAHYDLFRPRVGPKWKEHAGEASGALYDLGPHLIDQALQLFGLPDTISADLVRQRPGSDVDDFFHLVMGYGVMRVVLQASNVIKNAGPHFQIHGNQGSLIKYGMDPQQADLQRGIRPGDPVWGKDQAGLYAELTKEGDLQDSIRIETIPGCYETYYQGIYQAVTEGALPPVSAVDARHGIQVIECALKSHAEQRVIAFPKG